MARRGVIVAIVAVTGIIGFMFVSGIFDFSQGNLEESIKNIPANIEESIQNIQEGIPEIPFETTSIIPSKSKLIEKSVSPALLKFTILDITYSESKNPEYSEFVIIKIKADNLDKKPQAFNGNQFFILDQNKIRYDAPSDRFYLQATIPKDLLIKIEIPKDDSLKFSFNFEREYKLSGNIFKFGTI